MTNNDEDTSRQAESLWRSDDWADLRWAREHSTPQQIARHLLDPQWRNRDYNALDELVEMTHDADLSSLSENDLETLAASSLPELRQSVIRYKDTPARLLEDMARTESNTRLLQMLVESGRLSQNTIDLCCWNQTDSRLAASMLPKASDHLLVRLSGRDWWPSRKNAVESGRLDRARLSEMIEKENHPDVVSALIGTGEFDMDGEAKAIRRVITSPDLLTAYTNPMGRRYNLDRPGREVIRQAARTMLEHAPIGLILSMPDDDNENWRTLIDTAATEYADEINPNMLGLIAQAEGNNQTKTILGERLGKDTLSGTDENQTPTASPGTGGTYEFNLRLLGRLKADVDYFLGPSHAEKYLWAGSVDAQIAKLREIDGNIRPEDRPEWFTTEWIDQAEQAMRTPADGGIEDALDAALSGQYAAFENAIIGYIDAHDPDAGTSENGASQFAGYEITDRAGNDSPTSYRLDWFDDEGLVREGPKVTVKELTRMREGIFGSPDSWDSFGTTPSTSSAAASDVDFDSQERELAAQIIMQEGGTRQEVREQFTDEELDRIARDEMGAGTPEEADATKEKGVSDGGNGLTTKSVPTSGGPARPTVAATMEAEQLAFDFDDMPAELDFPQIQEENNSQTKLDMVSNLDSSRETEENDARKETTRNDGQVLPLPGGQEDEVPVHGGASAGTAQGAQETGDAGVGRLHGPGPEGLRPDDHRVRQPLGQDAPAPQAAGQLGPVVQGTQDGGASGRGDRHQERGRSPLTHIDRGLLDPDLQATGSSLERARANVCAIEVLRDLDDSGREPTDDDIRALAAYAGWGGAQKAFEEDGADPAWSEINTRLGELLTDAEYADARSSTLTAFYTPRPVVDAMWQALGKAGFGQDPKHPDMVLEPGCGTGNFIRSTPAGSSYGFTGIEADPISAGIARHLCADDDIINNRMERTGLPTDAFDLAVGNVPYSDAIRIDGTVIHDWFIQHSLDAVRPGGLVAVLTSRYTLDKNTSNMRRGLARKAELVAACRLPRETFDRQAGTEVVSDILILRKRDEPLAEADAAWTDTTEFRDGVNANRLFVDHPEYVAGTMAIGSGPFGPQIDVTGTGDITRLGEQVERILTGQLEQHGIDLHDRLGERANEPIVVPDKTQQAAMRYMVDANDHIWYGDMNGQIVPAHSRVAKGGDRRMASMLRLRDQAERLLAVERDPDTTDDAVAQGIRELDEAYDRFTASYGRLNSKENLRVFDPNNSDPSLNQLYTLEKTGSDGFEAKGDMLSKRVVTPMPPMPEHVDEPVEALAVSLDRVGHVDLDLIGHLLGTRDDLETVARLGDLIVTDPDDGTPLPADEYLSGDVGGELDHVDGLLRAMVDEPEQERVRAWLAENGIQAITPPSRVESCRRELIQAGAWQSATDPIHANKSVAEAPWFSNEFKEYGRGQRRAFACMFLDDCKPGVELLDKNWNAQQPKGNSLFYEVFDSGWSSDDDGTSNSAMRMLYKAVTADPEAIDDRTVATILNTSGFKHGPVQDALRKITDPSLWKVEDHGYYREAKCDYLALAKELRAHPETCEYLYAADADRLAHPTVEKRYGRYNSWNQKTFKPLDEVVDMEGLEQWRDRRATWMRDHPAEPADMDRLKSLQRLRGRLEQSMPVRLTHNDITAKLGSAWIPTGVIRDFMIETFGLETQPDITDGGMRSLSVSHDETTGNWQVNASLASKLDEETIRKYGLGIGAGRNPFEVVSGALNATTSNLTKPDPDDPTGKRRVRDAQATALLYQKRHTVEQAFTEWVWTDPARTRMLEDVYNTRFNRIHPREYDGSYLTFPGISTDIDLYDHQRNAVARILQSKEGTLVAHVVGAGKLDLDVPDCDVISVAVEATEAQKQAVDALVQRAELVRDGAVDPSDDNMLNITNDGRKVSLDPKLLDVADPDIQPMEGGKVQVCAEKIHEIWQEHAAEKATQLVFCDSSTTASGKWNIQSDLKRRLIDLGIPEDEIMFAAQEKDPQKKQALFEKVRKGEVRVLIGSTGTLGTGTNVQDRLFAIHDLDCPWKPAELEQRQGRVRRQGNMFDKAQDYRYVTVGTFDSYMFQTVERKARFISQIMSSGSPSREASDVDSTVLSLADMKAIATGDPNIAKRMELENQLTQMKLLKRAHADQQRSIRFKIDMQLQPTVDNLERLHGEAVDDEPKFHKAVEIRDQHLAQGVCGLDLGDGPITDRKQAIHDLVGIAHRLDHGQTMEVGEYCGLTVMVASKNMAVKGINAFRPFVGLKGEHEHWAGTSVPDINNSADNVIRQLDRIIANNTDTAQGLRVRLDNAKTNLESAWNALNTPWEGQQEYDDLTDQIAKMNLEIKNGQDTAPAGEDEQDTQADLAEAQATSVTVGFDPSEPSAFPTAAETTDVPMPDPCIDPSDDVSAGPGIGM